MENPANAIIEAHSKDKRNELNETITIQETKEFSWKKLRWVTKYELVYKFDLHMRAWPKAADNLNEAKRMKNLIVTGLVCRYKTELYRSTIDKNYQITEKEYWEEILENDEKLL